MHTTVFEAGWKSKGLMPRHREVVACDHRERGREVIGIDWTLSHHERGAEIFGVKRAYDYVDKRMSRYQTVVTAAIANQEMIDGSPSSRGAPPIQLDIEEHRLHQLRRDVQLVVQAAHN